MRLRGISGVCSAGTKGGDVEEYGWIADGDYADGCGSRRCWSGFYERLGLLRGGLNGN